MPQVFGSVSWYDDCWGSNTGSCQNCGTFTRHGAYPRVAGRADQACPEQSGIPTLRCYPCSSGTCVVNVTNRCNGWTVTDVQIRDALPAKNNCGVPCGQCQKPYPECQPIMDLNWWVFLYFAESLDVGRAPGRVWW